MTGAGTLLLPSPPTCSLLQPAPGAATSPYPGPGWSDHPRGAAAPLPAYLPVWGGPGQRVPSLLLLLLTPCLRGRHASPGNRASFMAASSPKPIKFV